ncbi:MAG: hypothetical protein ABJJ44_06015 [Paraglaciecola sp.]|uniref:hypothetical protein n=1 Tax=Paraglaciecola sp. TaxID=1920173 RepID=UPI00329860B7
MKSVGLFGTCRVSCLNGEGLSLLRKTKSNTTASKVGLIYQDDLAVYEGQPFNYTTKLQDAIDAIKYLKGSLFDGTISSANYDKTFFSLFCRGYSPVCFDRKECSEPKSWKGYDLIVVEVNSLRKILIKTERFGKKYLGANLPWNVFLEKQHQILEWSSDDFEIIEPTQSSVDNMLAELLTLIDSPLLIVGPYLLPETPSSRKLFGEDDHIPVYKINERRGMVRNFLLNSSSRNLFSYFDMTEHIKRSPALLKNQYHFSEIGERILYERIKSML